MIPEGWKKKSLEDVAEIRGGLAKGKQPAHQLVYRPYLRVANVQDGYLDLRIMKEIAVQEKDLDRYSLRYGDVVLTEGGDFDKLGRGAVWKEQLQGCLHQNHVFAVRADKATLLPDFFAAQSASHYGKSYYLSCAKRSTNLASINSTQLKQFPVLLPPILEQARIAEILSVWDRSIETMEALIANARAQKKALMQSLLTGTQRLPGFSADWRWIKFSEVFERVRQKNDVGNTNVLTISAQHGLISQVEYFNKSVASEDVRGYTLLRNGDFAYNKSYSDGYPMGAFKPLERYDSGIVSSLYICFRLANDGHDHGFFRHYFEAGLFNREISAIAQEGARNHGLLNVSVVDFFDTSLHAPGHEEQTAIAEVINEAEKMERTLLNQLAALRKEKSALMQQLLTGKRRVTVDLEEKTC